jgi:hypothetical protein
MRSERVEHPKRGSRGLIFAAATILLMAVPVSADQKDKANQYKMGTFVSVQATPDGTTSDHSRCSDDVVGVTCNWDFRENAIAVYTIKTDDGVWTLNTYTQVMDSTFRRDGFGDPVHFRSEKPNPLDFLKPGDRVLFRVEYEKKLGGTETDIFIPFASNTDKEAKFIGSFVPNVQAPVVVPPSDNVKAMCESHKLSLELEKQYCNSAPVAPNQVQSGDAHSQGAPTDLNSLVGKQVMVQRNPLCQPGTYTAVLTYAGKQAKVISIKPMKIGGVTWTQKMLDSLTPPQRAIVVDAMGAGTITVQFDDGTQLDSCAPVLPSQLSNWFELVNHENGTATSH